VLEKMAEGHPNAGIAGLLFVSQSAVEKHVAGYSRRVPAILRHLGS
jgi:DNA-binding NarL/FixJ family response regulator